MSGSMPGPECAGCQKPIRERFLLKALDQLWHEDCLKCACCDCRLGEVGSTLFTKANLILCKRDYLSPALKAFGDTQESEGGGGESERRGWLGPVAEVVAATRPFESLGRGIEFRQCLGA
ncbi:hypothetical protein MTO96_023802 [Rhipicephalus appendiculatus]